MLSIDILDIPSAEALLSVKNHLMGQEKNVNDWEQKQNEKNTFMTSLPYDYKEEKSACVYGYLDDAYICRHKGAAGSRYASFKIGR